MISNLDELIVYTERAATRHEDLADEICIRRRQLAPHFIAELNDRLPGLPRTYLSLVESLDLDGVAIGYFQLTPRSVRSKTLLDKLRDANDPRINPLATHFHQHSVYQIAAWEAEPVCVSFADGSFKVGQIVMVSIAKPSPVPVLLASTFEQFLLIAANLDDIRERFVNASDQTIANQCFCDYLNLLSDFALEMRSAWLRIAGSVLS